MQVLDEPTWRERRRAHEARVDVWIAPHLARRSDGRKHPVHDFLFTYYAHRPARLRRWHPGFGVALAGDSDLASRRGYSTDSPVTVTREHALAQRHTIEAVRRVLAATAARPAAFGCFGLHEWAMVYRADATRHDWPLRLGVDGTDLVVSGHRLACTHLDAYRFFTAAARPRNESVPHRERTEQPGCLHAGMDLYKHAFRLSPFVPSELVADCFALAREIREVDMRASPYDLSDLGYAPIAIETAEGKHQYVSAQRTFTERAEPLRARLIAECDKLL